MGDLFGQSLVAGFKGGRGTHRPQGGHVVRGAAVFRPQLRCYGGAGELLYALDQADLHGFTPVGLG